MSQLRTFGPVSPKTKNRPKSLFLKGEGFSASTVEYGMKLAEARRSFSFFSQTPEKASRAKNSMPRMGRDSIKGFVME